jgi:hypothetical protein
MRMSRSRFVLALCVAVGLTGPAGTTKPGAQSLPASIDLTVPGRLGATPSIAALDRIVAIVWGATAPGGATDIYLSLSRDAGATFASPVRVNRTPGDARVNGEQPPRVALSRAGAAADPVITVVWTSRRDAGTRLLQSRSTDGGRTFSNSTLVAGTDAPGNRGWEALAVDRGGKPLVAWLDHRDMAAASSAAVAAAHEGHTASGVEMAQKSKLYFATLDGAVAARPLAAGVCYCCKTAMATSSDGAILLAWRHVYPGDIRDIAFTMSRDGGRTFADPIRVSEDRWAINGCPENGPAMVVDRQNVIHLAWPTLLEGSQATLGLFYASSSDGRTFTPRRHIATRGSASHAQMAVDASGSLVLVWDEIQDGVRQVMFSRREASAANFTAPIALTTSARGSYPVVATTAGGVVVAWTSGAADASAIRVRRVSN